MAFGVLLNIRRKAWQYLAVIGFLGAALVVMGAPGAVHAQEAGGALEAPDKFVQIVGNRALEAVRNDAAAKRGDVSRIHELVNQYLLPHTNFEKTTRLAVGQHWRKATDEQKRELVAAFQGTLLRTYGSALSGVDKIRAFRTLPFRGDANADDVVVRSVFTQRNGPDVAVDYRLERTPGGWKIYDVNVEGIWLIQTYRTQFSQQVNQAGIDGLIDLLNQKNR